MIDRILEALVKGVEWYLATDLPETTGEAIGKIITYTSDVLIPLMWHYIHTIFPG